MNQDISIIILAAGKGTRMKSDLPKTMHKVANREMLNMVIDTAKQSNPKNIAVVISNEMEQFKNDIIKAHVGLDISFIVQHERKGTAHAVQTGLQALSEVANKVVILYGDTPLISANTVAKMVDKLEKSEICVLGFHCYQENGYGKLVIDGHGNLNKIVERKDATDAEKKITLCNSGVVGVRGQHIADLLNKVDNKNAAGEYYLTDIVGIANANSLKASFIETDEEEVLGVNSRFELANIEEIKQNQIRKKMMDLGVTLQDPKTTYFSFDTNIAADVIVQPHVYFDVGVIIESGVTIKAFSHISQAHIGKNCDIGPYARIRPGTEIEEDVKIGNFVEIKKSKIKKGAKVNHLSYVGDSEVGQFANIGAGTITCNYDGYNKSKTIIGAGAFIGSNSSLVAPVKIGEKSVIGAGSVITKNVEADQLAVSRARQLNIVGGGKNYHQTKSNKE